ncbi:unnamed protein product [Aureobasidium vineae]|uniref:Uncharacterized protein n=1 Tax=Aureobasidium vineae TaxID=2773715 RepID=A0A9N8JE68_9PEZI|nr:unnamed protein product [Aureobasidium vineae]
MNSMSTTIYTELDPSGQTSLLLLCKPTLNATTEQPSTRDPLSAHKGKQFTEVRLENLAIDTLELDTFLGTQSKELKKVEFINTHMHFLSTRDNIGESCALLSKIAGLLTHTLEVQSFEIKNLIVHYNDTISASVTYTENWEGVNEVRVGFAELVAQIKERGNRGLMQGQEVTKKPQSSFIEMERWEDEYGFAGEESDGDVYEHSEDEDEDWEM